MADWSENYRGEIPRDPKQPTKALRSEWFADRETGIFQLKVSAAYLGFDILVDVHIDHKLKRFSEQSYNGKGRHYYNEPWYQVTATAAHRMTKKNART